LPKGLRKSGDGFPKEIQSRKLLKQKDFLKQWVKYAEIEVSFSTHTAGGITEKDIEIAVEINKFA
jgi:Pterin 4 alpha carbinolamine dehydratase